MIMSESLYVHQNCLHLEFRFQNFLKWYKFWLTFVGYRLTSDFSNTALFSYDDHVIDQCVHQNCLHLEFGFRNLLKWYLFWLTFVGCDIGLIILIYAKTTTQILLIDISNRKYITYWSTILLYNEEKVHLNCSSI